MCVCVGGGGGGGGGGRYCIFDNLPILMRPGSYLTENTSPNAGVDLRG